MKKRFIALAGAAVMVLSACAKQPAAPVQEPSPTVSGLVAARENPPQNQIQEVGIAERSEKIYDYATFEEAVSEYATDAVIARYVKHVPFGAEQTLVEYEFAVRERVLGNAADTIFVYAENPELSNAFVENADKAVTFNPGDLSFDTETEYLLALQKIDNPLTFTHNDGFTFINDIVIDLDSPADSVMYSEPLSEHAEELILNDDTPTEEIVSFVEELTEDNTPGREFAELNQISDIIGDAPNVFTVEVGELLSAPRTDWIASDNYYVAVARTLKGASPSETEIVMTFAADTVEQGGRYIVAVEPLEEGYDDWFRLTSFDSLFGEESLDEIAALIG